MSSHEFYSFMMAARPLFHKPTQLMEAFIPAHHRPWHAPSSLEVAELHLSKSSVISCRISSLFTSLGDR